MSYVLLGVKYRAQGQLELDLSADVQALKASISNPASPPQCHRTCNRELELLCYQDRRSLT